ncbi:MAG TPA: 3-hydroxyacyl-CoA dehydrogenase NAD-binding domain-containing protein [Steroidobacteraceae bacterium]|nr:3-hydroxyacyl-CoA dehydrogenase NAD-binding domain-containing protein [Steroidobacteraceae bacterium]
MTIQYENAGGVAVVTIDRPPVNSLNQATRQALLSALRRALDERDVDAIVIWGGPRVFSAGADIEEFAAGVDGAVYASPTLPEVIDALDAAGKPTVAAIAGACLGGGLELALACHARVCSADAKLGLPEVKLGVLPGAGGTQRLPRLIGVDPALQLIVSGTVVDAQRAEQLGIVRVVAGDLLDAARRDARALIGKPIKRVSDLPARLRAGENAERYFSAQRAALKQPLPAPLACIEAVECTLSEPVSVGSRREAALFRQLLQTPESKALRYAFFGDRAAGKPPASVHGSAERPIANVGIVGAGTMGSGIAICCLDAGFATTLIDVTPAAVAAARARIEAHYEQLKKKGRLDANAAAARMQRLATASDYAALSGCDLAIEAVYEDMAVKQQVFRELDRVLRADAVLASNTSTLDLNLIAAVTSRAQDVVGLHFFSPANVMRLLEVVRGKATSESTLGAALRFGKSIGKTAVVTGVCDGFIGNRMFEEYLRQAYALVDVGVTPYRIDAALEAWGMAMGPFAVMDLAGGDIGWAIRKRRRIEQPDRPYSRFPDRVCELQRFGRKTGAGYYAYDASGRRSQDPEIMQLAHEHARAIGRMRTDVSDEEIVERCIFALVNEGAKLLEEQIAERASDIDVVYRNGYGFPAHRGGPLYFADAVGLDHVLRAMAQFRSGYEEWFWEPAPLLVDAARRGVRLTDAGR